MLVNKCVDFCELSKTCNACTILGETKWKKRVLEIFSSIYIYIYILRDWG